MKRKSPFLGLLIALLFFVACAPAESEVVRNEASREDASVLVYASPL